MVVAQTVFKAKSTVRNKAEKNTLGGYEYVEKLSAVFNVHDDELLAVSNCRFLFPDCIGVQLGTSWKDVRKK